MALLLAGGTCWAEAGLAAAGVLAEGVVGGVGLEAGAGAPAATGALVVGATAGVCLGLEGFLVESDWSEDCGADAAGKERVPAKMNKAEIRARQ